MALRWNWNDKCGEAVVRRSDGLERTMSLYQGNSYLIFVWEYEEEGKNMYTVWDFWADKDHAKIELGLKKDWDGEKRNRYEGVITSFRFNKNMSHLSETIGMIVKAFDNIDIGIYTEKGEK